MPPTAIAPVAITYLPPFAPLDAIEYETADIIPPKIIQPTPYNMFFSHDSKNLVGGDEQSSNKDFSIFSLFTQIH